ncbi:hypothetical protein NESM_000796700 [Novymonas esmeraldas]|uniref:Uncharacterized protein n=1 Tax=Novymonas esmeraldas TaxID=1808958 RepID=A0AAW0EZQ3_9TRYP
MWDPQSYIAQVAGSKCHAANGAKLPSFFDYTARLFVLAEEEEQLSSRIERERVGWKSTRFTFCGAEYTAHSSTDAGDDAISELLCGAVAVSAEDKSWMENASAKLAEELKNLQKAHGLADGTFPDTFGNLSEKSYAQEELLCSELRRMLPVPATVSVLLVERGSFHVLLKGDTCTIPITAMIDSSGAPMSHEGISLDAETLGCSNGVCRRCENGEGCCFITVASATTLGCAASLLAVEAVTRDEDVEVTLRSLVDAGVIACCSCIYNDGTVYQYEGQVTATHADSSAMQAALPHDFLAHRARIVRGSGNADAMHLLSGDIKKMAPTDAVAFERALSAPILVATLPASSGPSYFEVITRTALVGLNNGSLVLAVQRDSPLYNNVLKPGDTLLLLDFEDQERWATGTARQWVAAAKCDAVEAQTGSFLAPRSEQVAGALLFAMEKCLPAGDSVVLLGTVVDALGTETPPASLESICSSLFRYTPFVCKFLHRQHGPIGFVGYSLCFCSTAPQIAVALLPLHLTELIASMTDVDPAITLFFFHRNSGLFAEPRYPHFTETLPFPLHQLTGDMSDLVAAEITCRLLHLMPLESQTSVLLLLSVQQAAFSGSEILQFV